MTGDRKLNVEYVECTADVPHFWMSESTPASEYARMRYAVYEIWVSGSGKIPSRGL